MKPVFQLAVLIVIWLTVSAFSQTPLQNGAPKAYPVPTYDIPRSKDPLWDVLAQSKIDFNEDTGMYHIVYTDVIKQKAKKPITVSGFMMPLESKETHKHFLLTRAAPTCPFCLPGGPEEFIDVQMKGDGIPWTDDAITLSGRFELMNDPEMGLFFALKDTSKQDE